MRRGAEITGNVVDDAVVFCWRVAAAAREKPNVDRRVGEAARRKAAENSLETVSRVCCV